MEHDIIHKVTHLVFQLAVILAGAKVGGEICQRYLKTPPVLGELAVGIIIGPFALGQVPIPGIGPLFEAPHGNGGSVPVSTELYSVSQIAAVVLLFHAGIETDLKQFLRFAGPATAVAIGGVVFPFLFGFGATWLFAPGGLEGEALLHAALFVGAVMTATSVGITARVLNDVGRLDSPEGVTILAGAVVDDVLGILVLTIIVGMAAPDQSATVGSVALVGVKAIGFWLALMVGGILCAKYISTALRSFRGTGATVALALALAFLAAGLAESFGLAMIIGAYTIGLALSGTRLARQVEGPITSVYHALVPIFFVVMGMLVDVTVIGGVLLFGAVLSVLAIISKVAGSGFPALAVGFNRVGSWRIGIGMLPRGEVALIIAGIGLSRGIIGSDIFGVTILMTVVTTFMAPLILVPSFAKGGEGKR